MGTNETTINEILSPAQYAELLQAMFKAIGETSDHIRNRRQDNRGRIPHAIGRGALRQDDSAGMQSANKKELPPTRSSSSKTR
jgi:hypothetical protein